MRPANTLTAPFRASPPQRPSFTQGIIFAQLRHDCRNSRWWLGQRQRRVLRAKIVTYKGDSCLMSSWNCCIRFSNERPPAYPSPALLHHRGPRRHRLAGSLAAQPDPARRQPATEGARGEHRPAAFQPHPGRLHPDGSRGRPAAAGAQGGIGDLGFPHDGGFAKGVPARNAAGRHHPRIPNSPGSGRSCAAWPSRSAPRCSCATA